MKQTTLTSFVTGRRRQDSDEEESEYSESEEFVGIVELMWTRVFTVPQMLSKPVILFRINSDILFFKALKVTSSPQELDSPTLIFDPDSLKRTIRNWDTDSHVLPEAQILQYAAQATRIRQKFLTKALEFSQVVEEAKDADSALRQAEAT